MRARAGVLRGCRRFALGGVACLALGGCVTNSMSNQNTQLDAITTGVPVRPQPARPAAHLTDAARLSSARLVTVRKTTTAGATLRLVAPQALAPDCSALGDVVVKVMSPPDHGALHVGPGLAYPNYSAGDPPYVCDARKLPATVVTYQAARGFVGDDVAVVRIFFPDGKAPMVRFDITVN